jgi:hypothetical protein
VPLAEATVRTDYPELSIVAAGIEPGPLGVVPAPVTDALGQVWRIVGDEPTTALDELVLLTIDDAVLDATSLPKVGWSSVTELDGVTEGAAWLVDGAFDDLGGEVGPRIYWARPDGTTWTVAEVGVAAADTSDWTDLVLSAVPGSGVPVVLSDNRAELLYVYGPPTTIVSQSFTDVEGGTVTLTLWDSAMMLGRLLDADSLTEIQVDGRTGWRVEDTELGWVSAYWDAGNGWFAELTFDQGLADLADELIATGLVRLTP